MPTEKPFKVTDRRRINGYGEDPYFSEPVRQRYSGQRRAFHSYDKDTPQLLGANTRKYLMTFGRSLYANASIVRGALNEMASLATSSFVPQFDGDDTAWGEAAELWLYNHDRVCDVRGFPYNMDSLNRLLVLSVIRDGDAFVLLTESENGWPMFQLIPGHRVGNRGAAGVIESGAWAGYTMRDGAVVNEYGRAVAYNVLGDDEASDRIIDTASLIPVYFPQYADQVRGVSELACAVIDFQDVQDSRRLELVAQKLLSALTLVESNETGMEDQARGLLESVASTDTPADVTYSKEYYGGEVRYFRAGTGSKIEPIVGDRPTYNQQQFAESIIRQAMHGIGWSYDFSLDPTRVGGALGRVVVEKINRRLDEIRSKLLSPVRRVMDGYRISKAVMIGELPPSDEWFKWEYQMPARITADAKHSSDVSLQDYNAGFKTMSEVSAERGQWWQDTIDQKIKEMAYMIKQAERHGVPVEMIRMLTPNGNPGASDKPDTETEEDTQDDPAEE